MTIRQTKEELLEVKQAIQKKIDILNKLKEDNRTASLEENTALDETINFYATNHYATLTLEAKARKRMEKTFSSTYNPIILLSAYPLIDLLSNLPPNSAYDYNILLSLDDTGHTTPIRIYSDGQQIKIFSTDAAGGISTNDFYIDLLGRTLGTEAVFKQNQCKRQFDTYSCLTFSIQDLNLMSQEDPEALGAMFTSQRSLDDEYFGLYPKLMRNIQSYSKISKCLQSHSNSIVQKDKTLAQFSEQFIRSIEHFDSKTNETTVIQRNYASTYKQYKYINVALLEINRLESLYSDETLLENAFKRIKNQRYGGEVIQELTNTVNEYYAREIGCELENIQEITALHPELNLYQVKILLEYDFIADNLFDEYEDGDEDNEKYSDICACFKPNHGSSKIIYEILKVKSIAERAATFESIKKLDSNQINIIEEINKLDILSEEDKLLCIDQIINGVCFIGRKLFANYAPIEIKEEEEDDDDDDEIATEEDSSEESSSSSSRKVAKLGEQIYPFKNYYYSEPTYTRVDYILSSNMAKLKLYEVFIDYKDNKEALIFWIKEISNCVNSIEIEALADYFCIFTLDHLNTICSCYNRYEIWSAIKNYSSILPETSEKRTFITNFLDDLMSEYYDIVENINSYNVFIPKDTISKVYDLALKKMQPEPVNPEQVDSEFENFWQQIKPYLNGNEDEQTSTLPTSESDDTNLFFSLSQESQDNQDNNLEPPMQRQRTG